MRSIHMRNVCQQLFVSLNAIMKSSMIGEKFKKFKSIDGKHEKNSFKTSARFQVRFLTKCGKKYGLTGPEFSSFRL